MPSCSIAGHSQAQVATAGGETKYKTQTPKTLPQVEAATAAAQEAQRKTAARIASTLEANEAQLRQRRAAFGERQAHVELRNLCARSPDPGVPLTPASELSACCGAL